MRRQTPSRYGPRCPQCGWVDTAAAEHAFTGTYEENCKKCSTRFLWEGYRVYSTIKPVEQTDGH